MQNHLSTALQIVRRLKGIGVFAAGAPNHPITTCSTAGADLYFISHHKRTIKTHTKLTDQLRVRLLIARQIGQELRRPRLSDGAKMRDHLVTVHADAVIGNAQRLGVFIKCHINAQFTVIAI